MRAPEAWPVALGVWTSGNLAVFELLSVNAWDLSAAIGPCAARAFGPWTRLALTLTAATGPGGLVHHMQLDERVAKTTLSLGWRTSLAATIGAVGNWHIGVRVGLEDYLAPLVGKIWFNQPLESTALWTIAVAIDWRRPAAR